jgi:eukaryotic-like serine/threonine-protein kinase
VDELDADVYHRREPAMIGTSAGNYDITAQIGLGGMGAVYLARHSMLGRPAAIKVLRPELSHNRDLVQRFFNEARAATAIRHPGIVEIYDFGFLADNSAYIIMEFLDGESLGTRIRQAERVPWTQALILGRQIAGALAAAHEQQIVHRDLKPDNIFVVADPEIRGGERIKLLDFGIAKLSANTGESVGTLTGELLGTPMYMAPEQCRGAGAIDGRADLYALGCILYHLMCGRPPFVADGAGDYIAHHLYFAPDSPRLHEPGLPEDVEQLILWLLKKEPQERPANAAALIEAIDRLGPVPSRERSAPRPASAVLAQLSSAPPSTLDVIIPAGQRSAPPLVEEPDVSGRTRWGIAAGVAGLLIIIGLVWILGIQGAAPKAPISTGAPAAAAASAAALPTPSPPTPIAPAPSPPAPSPPAPSLAAPPTIAEVRFEIDSDPSDAAVWLDGEEIGRTPFSQSLRPSEGTRRYKLRKEGFVEESLEFAGAVGASKRVTLRKLPSPRRPARQPPVDENRGINPFE